MVGTDNKAIFRRLYKDSWNTGDLAVVDELLAPDFVNHEFLDDTSSAPHRELYKRAVVETRSAFPDWALSIEDMISEGDLVVARWRARGYAHWGVRRTATTYRESAGGSGHLHCARARRQDRRVLEAAIQPASRLA